MLFAIWRADVPDALRLGVRRLVIIALIQAAIFRGAAIVQMGRVFIAGKARKKIGERLFQLDFFLRDAFRHFFILFLPCGLCEYWPSTISILKSSANTREKV